MPYQLSQFLYACRWIGTLLVLAIHTQLIFAAPDEIAHWKSWHVGAYALGRIALIGFFVMSGFLVGGAILTNLHASRGFLKHYFVHRFVRIYVVLVPAIIITISLDVVGRAVFKGNPQGQFYPLLIVTNLLNLQGIAGGSCGANGPLWSVAYEFWFYIIFPLLVLPFAAFYSRTTRVIALGAGLILCAILSIPHKLLFFELFLVWSIGAAATLAARPILRSIRLSAVIYIVIVCGLAVMWGLSSPDDELLPKISSRSQAISDVVSALFFANLTLTLRFGSGKGWLFLYSPAHKFFADFSFTVYSIHAPILFFSRAAMDHVLGEQWAQQYGQGLRLASMSLIVTIILLMSFGLSFLTEKQVGRVRRFAFGVEERIGQRLQHLVRLHSKRRSDGLEAG